MSRFLLLLALLLTGAAAVGAQEAAPILEQHIMQAGGIERTYWLHVPASYTGESAVPVVVALHGRFGTGETIDAMTHLSALSDEEGFVAVYPDGVDGEWKYFGGILPSEALNTPDDTVFLAALVDEVAANLNVDLTRVYLMGFSNGGFMTYRMACVEVPNPFAAFGVAGALFYPPMELPCLAAPARPLIVEHGTADSNILWDGIRHRPVAEIEVASRSVLQSVSFFAGRNGCSPFGAERTDLPQSAAETSVMRFDFAECTTGQTIRFFAVVNGGHTWPGVDNLPREMAGAVNMDIDLSREFWDFFKDKSLAAVAEE